MRKIGIIGESYQPIRTRLICGRVLNRVTRHTSRNLNGFYTRKLYAISILRHFIARPFITQNFFDAAILTVIDLCLDNNQWGRLPTCLLLRQISNHHCLLVNLPDKINSNSVLPCSKAFIALPAELPQRPGLLGASRPAFGLQFHRVSSLKPLPRRFRPGAPE